MPSRTILKFAVLASFVFALAGGAARADDAAEAKRLYKEGTKSYHLGEFDKAIEQYKAAYKLKEDPVFLYNIAQAYRMSGDIQQAIFFYKSFLRTQPNAPNRVEVEKRIAELEDQLAKLKASSSAPPTDVVPPGGEPPVKIPPPDETAEGSEAGEEGKTPPPPDLPGDDGGSRAKPIYKKWWFWAGIGAVAVGTVAIVVATSGGDTLDAPESEFGTSTVFE